MISLGLGEGALLLNFALDLGGGGEGIHMNSAWC